MSDLPTDLERRVDAAMKEIGFVTAEEQPVALKHQAMLNLPHVFSKDYERGNFKYLVTITVGDIARHGLEDVIARKIQSVQKSTAFKVA